MLLFRTRINYSHDPDENPFSYDAFEKTQNAIQSTLYEVELEQLNILLIFWLCAVAVSLKRTLVNKNS